MPRYLREFLLLGELPLIMDGGSSTTPLHVSILQRSIALLQRSIGVTVGPHVAPTGSLGSGIMHVGKTDLYFITMKR